MCVNVHVPRHAWGVSEDNLRKWFSSFTSWVLGIEFGSSVLAAAPSLTEPPQWSSPSIFSSSQVSTIDHHVLSYFFYTFLWPSSFPSFFIPFLLCFILLKFQIPIYPSMYVFMYLCICLSSIYLSIIHIILFYQ